ncbi:hypothetical protein R3I94_018541 [Phoxinus phoxinus]
MKSVSVLDAAYVFLCYTISWSANINCHEERHFLHYKFTALSKSDTFPEFSAECVYDHRRIKNFSDGLWTLTDEDWTEALEDPPDPIDWFLHQIRTLSNCTHSPCSELHTFQRIIGCELEKLPDGSVNLTVFDEYGFDGEDFMAFNPDTMQWIDKNPKAKRTKVKWDRQTGRNQYLKHYLKTCTDWISAYNNIKKTDCETETRWPCIAVFSAVAAVLLFTGISFCIYLNKWSKGKIRSYIAKSGEKLQQILIIRPL